MKINVIKKIFTSTITCMIVGITFSTQANATWKQDSNGWWNDKGNGNYSIGWDNINDNWYYFNSNGYMKTGWLQDGANLYYLNSNGSMATNTNVDGRYLNNTGVWIKDNNTPNSNPQITNKENEENVKVNKNLVSIFYKLDDFSIDKMATGTQSLKSYYGDNISEKSEIENTYGMILIDVSDYNMTRDQLMDCNWKDDIKLVENNGQVELIVE